MNVRPVKEELQNKYPDKNVVVNNTGEIICEISPGKEESVAIAVIDKSLPHFHKVTTETYEVIKGKLDLYCDGIKHTLNVGDKFVVNPGSIHYAEGKETWIKCFSKPGWSPKDHFLAKG